ncbi:MAG: 23S rRNA (guanosine(2251)-2'-O)-methyltransferase RlmB [Bacteroidota bacterium]
MDQSQIVFGVRALIETIEAKRPITKVYLQKGNSGELFKELEQLLRKNSIRPSYVPIEKLNKLAKGNHQGAVAAISPVDFRSFETVVEAVLETAKTPLFLLLDQITDVRNFGAIIRTSECTGVNAIIVPKTGAAPINSVAIKTSAGAALTLPIAQVDHIKDAVYYLQASGVQVVAATEKATQDLYEVNFKKPTALIMGSEDKGIASSLLKLADYSAKLPMLGKISSLNVSVACGAFLYEIVRQRHT